MRFSIPLAAALLSSCAGDNSTDPPPPCSGGALCEVDSCGDGIVQPPEQCETSILNGATCASLGFASGTLACASCAYDTAGCRPIPAGCGDGHVNGFEVCDGGLWAIGTNCSAQGQGTGTLTCVACQADYSGCSNPDVCAGNNWYNDGATCDGCTRLGGTLDPDCSKCGAEGSCVDWFDPQVGDFTCVIATGSPDPDCTCGNNVVEDLEYCDGAANAACTDFAFSSGTMGCTTDCLHDFSACVP